MLNKLISKTGNINTLYQNISNNKKISIINMGEGEKIEILNDINRPVLFIVPNNKEALNYYDKFINLNQNINICTSIPDILLSDYSPNYYKFLEFINNLDNNTFNIHITTPDILLLDLPLNNLSDNTININIDDEISLDNLFNKLCLLGYSRKNNISEIGEFSCKGEVIDIIPFSKNGIGYRIILDFDTVSKIKELDDNFVNTVCELDTLNISSNNFFKPDQDKLTKVLNDASSSIKNLYDNYVQNNHTFNSLWFLPFEKNLTNLYSYLNDNFVIAFSDIKEIYDYALKAIKDYEDNIKESKINNLLTTIHSNPLKLNNLINIPNLAIIGFQYLNNSNRIFNPNSVFSFKCLPNIKYGENYNSLLLDLKSYYSQEYTTVIFVDNDNYNTLNFKLNGKIPFYVCKNILDIQKKNINIINKKYCNSFNFVEEKLAVIGSDSIGKQYNIKKETIKSTLQNNFTEFDLPSENDYIVHKIHGIGKCLGIKNLELSKDCKKDYVIIEYKGSDKLYLPIENIDSISKYIGQDEAPSLSKMGGVEFEKIKTKAKKEIKNIANNLIAIYKSRQDAKGYIYPKDDEIQNEFEKSFPYELTIDQKSTLDEIKNEMYEGKLIDRLICGDVGFGKTEIALRIAFKTILAGKNVAILCPTTILSEQHYNTALSRMASYGIKIAVLNRFKTPKEVDTIINDLALGRINLIVGTHKILNDKIKIKNLGLLIIDEEQKFGVEHKEKIKQIKQDVNVLTLSATPIPRTLHLSLSGIRDISTIQTPPTNKLNTQVSVLEYNEDVIKLAIEKEINRGGQVLIIYNYVETITSVVSQINNLTNHKFVVDYAHGQMSTVELENKIINLYNGKTQILISTTLIENGVDLPNANTLIILNSDKLGLSQLYQLKGRVGRGSRDSYAYFMYQGILSEIAYKRLKAISEYSAMGSGFKISLKDMEIRGAGNIFGNEQHGHMIKIGYAMYISILNNTIAELNNKKVNEDLFNEIKIETDFDTNIPSSFAFNTNQKILLYTKIAKISSKEKYDNVVNDIREIYGDTPVSLINLCKLSLIKNKLVHYNASKIILRKSINRIEFKDDTNLEKITSLVSNNLLLDTSNKKINLLINNISRANILDYLIDLL